MTTSNNHAARRSPATANARQAAVTLLCVIVLAGTAGCSLTPAGLAAERDSMDAAGAALYRGSSLEDLPMPAGGDDWRGLLRRALLANGDVRAAWFEWKAAVEKVRGASGWPNTNVSLGYSYLFSDAQVKSFDRSTFNVGFDSMENLSFPAKTVASGRVALADARAAGERFRAAKFGLQRRVLDAWLDLALAAEQARLADESASLAAAGSDAALAVLGTGGEQGPALGARIEHARSDDASARARARLTAARATLAGLTAIEDAGRIAAPARLPLPRTLPPDPRVLLAAVDDGPQVKGLEADRRTRKQEEELARLQWIPDVNPFAAFAGGAEQMIGAIAVLPTTIAEIRSGIAVAKAMRGAAAARALQARRDKRGELASAIVAARDAERSRMLLETRVLPAATAAASSATSAYTAGRMELAGVVEARRLAVDVRREIAEAAVEREKQLAAIEEILGADLETFGDEGATRYAAARPPHAHAAIAAAKEQP